MEGAEAPFTTILLLCIHFPDMIALRLRFFAFFIEAQDVRLMPKVVANLKKSKGGEFKLDPQHANQENMPSSLEAYPLDNLLRLDVPKILK